ncbi:ABC transporter ATP-binding protein [Clostridium sp.]|uniref:ABC transporter ATP-binding protein n=1 Tax=Clostridium sp. TaxID=1506 RepID=UPI0034641A88
MGVRENSVEVKSLSKIFITRKKKFFKTLEVKEFKAVDNINFNIKKGEIFGLLGPNGAGKTTTIKMITGLLMPTTGEVMVMEQDVNRNQKKSLKNIGTVLAGDRSIYWKLTGRENLEYFAALYGCDTKEGKLRADKIIKRLHMEEKSDVLVEKYSTGMKQKIALGKALIPEAPVVLLDEPTLGLDPQSALNLREIIMEIKEEGRTVLLTTHYMEEADFLCDRIAIIDGGKIIALDTPENLKKSISKVKILKITINNCNDKVLEEIKAISYVENINSEYKVENRSYEITIHHNDGEEIIQEIIDILLKHNIKLLNIKVEEPSLEDVFINLTGKSLRD